MSNNKEYEIISVEKKEVSQAHVLFGTIGKIGGFDTEEGEVPEPGKANVTLEGYGVVENIEIFYHCEDSIAQSGDVETPATKAKATETLDIPFREGDEVIVVNYGDIENLDADKMRIVGFKDGLPRYCVTEVIYVYEMLAMNDPKGFVWDTVKDDYAVIKDEDGNAISFPCEVAIIEHWAETQVDVARSLFGKRVKCGSEAECPTHPDDFHPYPSHEWSETNEAPAGCDLGEGIYDICSKSTWAATGEEWRYGTGYDPPRPLYCTPTSNGGSDYILTHALNKSGFRSCKLKPLEFEESGYCRIQEEGTNLNHFGEVGPTGAYPPGPDPGYGETNGARSGIIKAFTHFCESEEDNKGEPISSGIRELEYSAVKNFVLNRGGYVSGTLIETDLVDSVTCGGVSVCSNKTIVNMAGSVSRTTSRTDICVGTNFWWGGPAWEVGEETHKAFLDIVAQADFYPTGTKDVKVRELKRNIKFEQAMINLDRVLREEGGFWPPGGSSGEDPIPGAAIRIKIYEINEIK